IWRETVPLPGTLGERYFVEHRNIDIAGLDLSHAVRWHAAHRMIVARMSNPVTDEGVGIHRTFLDETGSKIERKMLGGSGIVRLWPDDAVEQGLVIGEGIETTLAAALKVELRGTRLQPAWATLTTANLAPFPVLPGVESLTILVDNDASHAGQVAAKEC